MHIDLERRMDELFLVLSAELRGRATEGSMELRNAALKVLRGRRSGRVYRIPGTKRTYRASAPGEPPAVRTGLFRLSWHEAPREGKPAIETLKADLAKWLEEGTRKMESRPYVDPIRAKAWPRIQRIYRRRYLE